MFPKWYSDPTFSPLHSPVKQCSGEEELVSQGDDHPYVGIKELATNLWDEAMHAEE